MSVCYFNDNYDKKYDCQYEIKGDSIEIVVEYNIMDEIPEINVMKTFYSNTEFEKRDILIIDNQTRMNYLLKAAYYCGYTEILGSPDGGYKTKFAAIYYYKYENYEKLCEISNNENIKKIRVYSKMINELIGYPSLARERNENEYIIKLKKDAVKPKTEINKDNIKYIEVSDDWKSEFNRKNNKIDVCLNGYIEVNLEEKIEYEEVYEYVKELIMFLQLLKPCKFRVDKIVVDINKTFFELCIPMNEIKYTSLHVNNSVKVDLMQFLFNCYTKIPYRNSKNEVRNIPYIILNTSRNIEDNFLMFYRFIECYYKQQHIKGINNSFIRYSIDNNYKNKEEINNIENMVQEIICLRNHYVHNGYHISNKKLYIAFPKIEKKANPKNYRAENVDFDWIYKRTKILYEIVIDIIFKNMLQYNNYEFNKHF